MHWFANASEVELKWTAPAVIGAILFLWRIVTRGRDAWPLFFPPIPFSPPDLPEYQIYAVGGLLFTGLLFFAEICFVIPGAIAMALPNPPPPVAPSPNGNLLINGLLVGQLCMCAVAVVDRFFHQWLKVAHRKPAARVYSGQRDRGGAA